MPDGDDVLRLFKNAMSYRNNRRVLIDAAKSEYAKELEVLQDKGEDIVDKLKVTAKKIVKGKDEQKPKKPETEQTAPVLAAERYEKSFMNMNIDAAGSVMRPNAPVIHKKSSFFKNIKYDVSVSNIVSSNDIGNNMVFVRDLDFFDKTLTLNLQKTGSRWHRRRVLRHAPLRQGDRPRQRAAGHGTRRRTHVHAHARRALQGHATLQPHVAQTIPRQHRVAAGATHGQPAQGGGRQTAVRSKR